MDNQNYIKQVDVNGRQLTVYDINLLKAKGIADISRLPFSIKILVENLLRHLDGKVVKKDDLIISPTGKNAMRLRWRSPIIRPGCSCRILPVYRPWWIWPPCGMPWQRMGGDPKKINPLVPVDLVVDHSVQVDYYGTTDCQNHNVAKEYERNGERYALLKWAQKSFANFNVVPPRSGICHQVNLEYLGQDHHHRN